MANDLDIDVKSLERIVTKLDDSIEKLTEVSGNISKLLAVHEERMNNIEKSTDRNEDDIRDIHDKIHDFARELVKKIDQVELNIETKLAANQLNSNEGHDKIQRVFDLKMEEINKRLTALEAWRWLVIGGAVVVGWLINRFFK
jgi:chromosome segregation ATPase